MEKRKEFLLEFGIFDTQSRLTFQSDSSHASFGEFVQMTSAPLGAKASRAGSVGCRYTTLIEE